MKKIKSYITSLAAMLVAAFGLGSCQDNVDAPAYTSPKADIEPNISLIDLKTMFYNDAKNYAEVIEDKDDPERRFIIHGTVISSDEEGNIFKSLVIQDETAALAFSIDSYNLYLNYRPGQEIVMDVTGLEIGKYAGLEQIGRKSWYENGSTWQVSFMAYETFRAKAQLNGKPEVADIDTLTVNSFGELSKTDEGLRKWQSQLVRLKNVYFEEGGERKLSVWHTSVNEEQNTTIIDRSGDMLTVRTSGYSTFFNRTLPVGNIDIVGILSYYNDAWQLLLIDGEGIIEVGEQPGTKEKPYTVSQAIDDERSGIKANGWVKGYIVGTLAPEVEDKVASNSDIQWEAPFVISTSLVIAPSATTTDYNECIVMPIAPDSPLQQYGNLRQNPANLGKEILVKGDLTPYLGTWGLTGNTGKADEFEIEGVTVDTGAIAEGDGNEATPYNVAQIVAMRPSSTTEAVKTGVWVEGYIVGSMPTGGSSTTLSATNFSTADAATTNLVLGPTPDCTDPDKCVGVQLPTSMRAELALANVPSNLGRRLAVKGDIMKYCNGPGVKNLTANRLGEGGSPVVPEPPVGGDFADGDGQQATPFNVGQVIAFNPASTTDAVKSAVWVKGYIVGSIPTTASSVTITNATFDTADAATTNLVLGPTADCKDVAKCITIQLPTAMRGELALANVPGNLGKVLAVKGDIMKYCGAAGVKNLTEFDLAGGSVTPEPPTPGTTVTSLNVDFENGIPSDWSNIKLSGDKQWYQTTYNSNGYAAMTGYKGTQPPFDAWLVSPGVDIAKVTDKKLSFRTQVNGYGSTTSQFRVFVLTSADPATASRTELTPAIAKAPASGYSDWVNSGELDLSAYSGIIYIGFEFYATQDANYATWCVDDIKLNAGGGGSVTPDPVTPDPDPVTPGDAVSVSTSLFKAADGSLKTTVTIDGYTLTFDSTGAATPTAYNEYQGVGTIRAYADNTLTISGPAMAKIVFTLNTSTGSKRYTTFTPSTGSVGTQAADDSSITWTGNADKVVFTVGHDATLGSDGPSKRGQIHIAAIEIYPAK